MKTRRIRNLAALVMLGAALAVTPMASAQSRKEKAEEASKRSLEGLVTDAGDNVVIGAVVKLKDLKTLQVRSFITKDDGKYHFYGLSINNDYEVIADSNGMSSKSRTLSVYDSRKKPNLDLKVEKK
jgi:Carboxypeptidase regulatory-like domain